MFSLLLSLSSSRVNTHSHLRRHVFRKFLQSNDDSKFYGFIFNCDQLNILSKPSTTGSSIIRQPKRGKIVELLAYSDSWYKISIDGDEGYGSRQYIRPLDITTTIGKIMYRARTRLLCPYQDGKSGPGKFDSPGLVSFAFTAINLEIPSTIAGLIEKGTSPTSVSPADVLFFSLSGNGKADHVALVTDVATIIHASTTKNQVVEEAFTSEWSQKLVGIRRYL